MEPCVTSRIECAYRRSNAGSNDNIGSYVLRFEDFNDSNMSKTSCTASAEYKSDLGLTNGSRYKFVNPLEKAGTMAIHTIHNLEWPVGYGSVNQ